MISNLSEATVRMELRKKCFGFTRMDAAEIPLLKSRTWFDFPFYAFSASPQLRVSFLWPSKALGVFTHISQNVRMCKILTGKRNCKTTVRNSFIGGRDKARHSPFANVVRCKQICVLPFSLLRRWDAKTMVSSWQWGRLSYRPWNCNPIR